MHKFKKANSDERQLGYAPVPVAARILIARRLKLVRKSLKKAAKRADEDPKHVHRLRVATREANAAIQVFEEFLPKKPRRQILRKLKQIRKAAANARDLDVFIENHRQNEMRNKRLFKRLIKKRKKAQQPIVAVFDKTRGESRYRKHIAKLLSGLQQAADESDQHFSTWASTRISQLVEEFFNQNPVNVNDSRQLHQFRIAAKKFRYSTNVLSAALPPGTFAEVNVKFKTLQDILGEINDHVVAVRRLKTLKNSNNKVRKLLARENELLQSARSNFSQYWQPEMIAELRAAFTQVLS